MGWRAWDAYERDAEERRRTLPWQARYNWRRIVLLGLAFAVAVAIFLVRSAAFAQSPKLTDDQVITQIIQDSRGAYYATGHPCACPYDRARNGSSCGGRSAYSRPGGASPKCYPKDVTAADIAHYRERH